MRIVVILYYLLLADEGAPQHADTLADHRDFQVVLLLEPVDDVLEGWVAIKGEAVPERPLGIAILVLRGGDGFGKAEEGQSQIDEAILVIFAVRFVVNQLKVTTQDRTLHKPQCYGPCRVPSIPDL